MKILKSIACFAAAAVMSVCTVLPAFADAEEEERVIDPYTEDESMLTDDTSAPTLSFDMSKWDSIVTVNDAAKKYTNMTLSGDNKTAYQGQSLKVSVQADSDFKDGLYQFAWEAKDADGKALYPETQGEGADELEYITAGFELHASDFGLNYFDGGMLTFKYRFDPEAKGKLMDDSVFVSPFYDDYKRTDTKYMKLQYNDTDSNNVNAYANGVMSISDEVGVDKIVFTVPLVKKTDKINVLYLDNIVFTTKTDKRVINLDGFNENATEQKGDLAIEVEKKDNVVSITEETETTKSKAKNTVVIVGIVVLGIVVVGAIVFLILKSRKRFY